MKVQDNFFEIYSCEPGETNNGKLIVDDIVSLIDETRKRDRRFEKYSRYIIGVINTTPADCLFPDHVDVCMEHLLIDNTSLLDAYVQAYVDEPSIRIIATQAKPYADTPELDALFRSLKQYHEMNKKEKKLFDDALKKSVTTMESARFQSINNFSKFEASEAMVYKNLFGIAIARTADKLVEENRTAKRSYNLSKENKKDEV